MRNHPPAPRQSHRWRQFGTYGRWRRKSRQSWTCGYSFALLPQKRQIFFSTSIMLCHRPLHRCGLSTSPDIVCCAPKLIMRTAAGNPPVCHDEDLIGIGDGRKPVGNDNDRLALYQPGYCLLNNRRRSPGRCRRSPRRELRQAHFQHGPGNGDPLPFPSGKMGAASAHHRLITIFQAADKSVAAAALATVSTSASLALGLPMRIFSRTVSSNR